MVSALPMANTVAQWANKRVDINLGAIFISSPWVVSDLDNKYIFLMELRTEVRRVVILTDHT